jgi:hypothetical protein
MNLKDIEDSIKHHNDMIDVYSHKRANEMRYVKDDVSKYYMTAFNNHPKSKLIKKTLDDFYQYTKGCNSLRSIDKVFSKLLDLGVRNLSNYKIITNLEYKKENIWYKTTGNICISKKGFEIIPINGYNIYNLTKTKDRIKLIKQHGDEIQLYLDDDGCEIMNVLIKYCELYNNSNLKNIVIPIDNSIKMYKLVSHGKYEVDYRYINQFVIKQLLLRNDYCINIDYNDSKLRLSNNDDYYQLYLISIIWDDISSEFISFVYKLKEEYNRRCNLVNNFRDEISPYVLAGEL